MNKKLRDRSFSPSNVISVDIYQCIVYNSFRKIYIIKILNKLTVEKNIDMNLKTHCSCEGVFPKVLYGF